MLVHRLRRAGQALAIVALYAVLGRASLLLATVHLSSSPVWPPAGFAIGLLILLGLRWWPTILAGAFLVNVTTNGDIATSALIAVGNTGEAVLAAGIVRTLGGRQILDRMQGVAGLGAAAIAGAAVSATVGVGALVAAGTPAQAFWAIWQTWFLGNLAGTLLVAPAMLVCRRLDRPTLWAVAISGATGFAAFATTGMTLFLLLPLIAWMTIRLPRHALAAGLLALAAGTVTMTLLGRGPFWGRDANEALLLLQMFLIGTGLATLTLSAGVQRRSRRPNAASWGGAAMAIGPMVAAAAFIGLALHPTIASLDDERRDAEAKAVLTTWEDAIQDHGARLQALRGLYESSSQVTRAEFDHFVALQGWHFGAGGSTAVGFARAMEPEEVAAYEASVRNDTALPGPVREAFAVFPPPTGPAVVVDHVYPMAPEPGAIGLDLNADPQGAAALTQAAATDRPTATAPVAIHTPGGEFPGFFVSLPVYQEGRLLGYVVLAQTVDDVAQSLDTEATYRITDITSEPHPLTAQGTRDGIVHEATLSAWGRTWRLDVTTPTQLTDTEAQAPWFILAGGAALSLAMAGVVYAHDTTRARAQEMSRALVDQARIDASRLNEIKRLEDRDQFRRRFLNMVAHELRTPLTPIRTQTYLLRQRLDADHSKGLDILERGVGRLSAVVDDLLVAAKLESEGMALDIAPTDVHALVAEAVEAMQNQARADGTRITWHGDAVTASMDSGRIAQVLDNLLTNALKFAKGGHVQVGLKAHRDEVTITVQDDGIGIDPARMNEVGQPFVQVHDERQVGVRGTGLGLYICKSIAKLHQGRLEITSDGPGKGTMVRLRLPIESVAAAHAEQASKGGERGRDVGPAA